MKNIIKKITSIFVVSVMAMSAIAVVNAETQADISDEPKDYTQAPYYNDLMEWFDRFDYTEEQRKSFMSNTEVMDLIVYDDELWNDGSDDNAIAPIYDPVPPLVEFPIRGYEAGKYFSKAGTTTPCTHHNSDNSSCYTDGSCGCKSFLGGIQCFGFAKFVYWSKYGVNFTDVTKLEKLSGSNWTTAKIQEYIKSKLRVGSHIRLHLRGKNDDYDHSIIVTSINSTGIGVYDANWEGKCKIRMTTWTWDNIFSFFDRIDYSNY